MVYTYGGLPTTADDPLKPRLLNYLNPIPIEMVDGLQLTLAGWNLGLPDGSSVDG